MNIVIIGGTGLIGAQARLQASRFGSPAGGQRRHHPLHQRECSLGRLRHLDVERECGVGGEALEVRALGTQRGQPQQQRRGVVGAAGVAAD